MGFISDSNIQRKSLSDELTKAEIENDKAITDAKLKSQQDLVSATSSALGSLVTLAGEGTKAGKAAALAQILIDTASGISSAIAGATAAAARAAAVRRRHITPQAINKHGNRESVTQEKSMVNGVMQK